MTAPSRPARATALAVSLLLASAAGAAEPDPRDPRDPWEGYNRAVFRFNLQVDRKLLRPVARGYRQAMPAPLRSGVSNAFDNLEEPLNLVNDALQGKPLRAGNDLLRLVVNSTIGLGGLFDPATRLGLRRSTEDFGQTFGKWGVGPGPYLVLPFLPPTTLRDGVAMAPDNRADPLTYLEDGEARVALKLVDMVDARQRVLDYDALVDEAYDPYTFVRNALLDRRAYQVRDGAPDPAASDYEDFEDEETVEPQAGDARRADAPAMEPPPH